MNVKTPYIRYSDEISENGTRLICLAHAGGSASAFATWSRRLSGSLDVLPVQLPGHENRIAEPLFKDITQASTAIADALMPLIEGKRFGIFGHSLGGLLAYKLALVLESRGVSPEICFISSTFIDGSKRLEKTKYLDDDGFMEKVFEYGALHKDSPILKYKDFREVFLKILRADFEMLENFTDNGDKLKCPILALCGDQDPKVDLEKMHDWEKYTEENVDYKLFEGDHFFFYKEPEKLLSLIEERLK